MSYLSAIVLGLIQGIAEFLPISSSGHLAFFQNFFGLTNPEEDNLFFDVLLHLGTLVAVFIAYRKEIGKLLHELSCMFFTSRDRSDRPDMPARRMILLLIVATLPLLVVLPVKSKVESLYYNTFFIGFAFILTGILLAVSDRFRNGSKTEKNATVLDALLVGVAQAFAVVPGLSRSGTTISAGLFRGFDRQFAVRFSFLLSIPAVIGANLLSLIDAVSTGIDWSLLPMYLLGMLVAGISGYAAIRLLKYIAEKGRFGGFAWYCWGAGIVTLVLSLMA